MAVRNKIAEWLKRYLPAEAVSMLTTLAAGMAGRCYSHNMLVTALAGTWGGNLGYYGYIFTIDFRRSVLLHRRQGRPYTRKSLLAVLRSLAVEFGVAELADSLLFRPAFMYFIPLFTGHFISGMIIGKLCGDITFYIPAVIGYELHKRRLEKR